MKINRENYESFFIDYLEGNLDELQVNDFIEFLQVNKDLKEELSLFEPVYLKPEDIPFRKKDALLKQHPDPEDAFNENAVAWLEGDLDETGKNRFTAFLLAHPEKRKELSIFERTILKPDNSIKFSKKKRLYRKTAAGTFLLWSVRIAAVLVLALSVYIFNDTRQNEIFSVNQTADLQEKFETEKVEKETHNTTADFSKGNNRGEKGTDVSPFKKIIAKQVNKIQEDQSAIATLVSVDPVKVRIPVDIPDQMPMRTASLHRKEGQVALAAMPFEVPDAGESINEERLLADIIKEKTGINAFRFSTLTKAGLKLVSGISGDKFSYETNEEGKITGYNFDSRLMAFSIPVNNEENK